ncbi:hypothetical protein [Lactococcus ileimucosae]|uniref:Uncharacterized protein n=1 Tax=Lactococcus ileimucosae TaxID=2941329 RepID=A0ABV4D7U6_9LACT
MAKDKNADKRHEYNLSILYTEQAYDELQAETQQLNTSFDELEQNLTRSFQVLQALEDEEATLSGRTSSFSEVSARKQFVMKGIQNQKEELNSDYNKSKQILEDRREQLQKERDTLSWD